MIVSLNDISGGLVKDANENGEEVHLCIQCEDTEGKLFVNRSKRVAYCFRCGVGYSLTDTFVDGIHFPPKQNLACYPNIQAILDDYHVEKSYQLGADVKIQRGPSWDWLRIEMGVVKGYSFGIMALPCYFLPLYTATALTGCQIYVAGAEHPYKYRTLGRGVSWHTNSLDKYTVPRYLLFEGMFDYFNSAYVLQSTELSVCCVYTRGNTPSTETLQGALFNPQATVYICYDNDKLKPLFTLYQKLHVLGFNVKILTPPRTEGIKDWDDVWCSGAEAGIKYMVSNLLAN